MRRIHVRSAPAQKLRPLPHSTTTRTSGSTSTAATASVRSAMSVSSKALWTSGRSSTIHATPSRRSSVSARYALGVPRAARFRVAVFRVVFLAVGMTLHPENAEARGLDRPVEGSRNREPEHAARVGGVDDAVVPQACARVIGMALALVLRADRRLERLLVLVGPGAASGLDRVPANRRQHRGGLLAAHDGDARIGPHPQEARPEGAAAHPVIAGAVAAA